MTNIKFLTAAQVAKRWESVGITGLNGKPISKKTLDHWRWQGAGPQYQKPFGFIRYPIEALRDFEIATFGTTCDPDTDARNDNKTQKTGENEAA